MLGQRDRGLKEDRLKQQGVLKVTKSHLLAATAGTVLVIGLAVCIVSAQPGQSRTAMGPQPKIALLDVNYIFDHHTGLKARMADLKAEMEKAREWRQQEYETIRKSIAQLQDMDAGSEAYKQLEEQTARRKADLDIQVRLQNKEFLNKEAKVWHTAYQDIWREVNYYASQPQNNIALVLSFDGDPVDKEQPDSVLRDIRKQVIWFSQELDITPIILERLNLRAGTANRTQSPGQRSRPGVVPPTYR